VTAGASLASRGRVVLDRVGHGWETVVFTWSSYSEASLYARLTAVMYDPRISPLSPYKHRRFETGFRYSPGPLPARRAAAPVTTPLRRKATGFASAPTGNGSGWLAPGSGSE
jgi:hypothetical protein